MKAIKVSNAFKTAKHVITANSPVLLVGTAIAGVVATGILAAKGGYEARGIIDDFEEENDRESTVTEKFQLTWLCMAPPVLTGASTIAATIGVHAIHTRRFAMMSGLYAVASTRLDDYQEKAEELLGVKKTQAINDAVGQKQIDRTSTDSHERVVIEEGDKLCHDEFGGRYVGSTLAKLQTAMSKVHEEMRESDHCSLNDFYAHAGFRQVPMGDELGWSGTKPEIRVSNGDIAENGEPCISFRFQPQPQAKYRSNR